MRLITIYLSTVMLACSTGAEKASEPFQVKELIYEDHFEVADPSSWIVESEDSVNLSKCISDGNLIMDVPGGLTIWNTTRFEGNVMFEFAVTVVDAGGPNDRVSDLNCFWMATDPAFPDDFFKRSSWRQGKFWNYYTLDLYYVGFGGHNNSKTRMRRYDAALKPPPPIIREYDDPEHLIKPNQQHRIRIACYANTVAYFFNDEKIFELRDDHPYKEGYFGFRTTANHMRVDYFKTYDLEVEESNL